MLSLCEEIKEAKNEVLRYSVTFINRETGRKMNYRQVREEWVNKYGGEDPTYSNQFKQMYSACKK